MKNTSKIIRRSIWLFMILFVAGSLTLTSCAAPQKAVQLKFADAGWDSIQLHNSIAGYIIRHGYGYATDQVSGTTAITWKALLENDVQIYMEVWSENIATYQDDLADGQIQVVSTNFNDNAQGLYVPRYVIEGDAARGIEPMAPDLKSVQDLAQYAEVFKDPEEPAKGRLYGAISGWEVDKILYNKYLAYNLDQSFNYFQPGSDAALAASLVSAYEKGEPWVGYYWEPTWISGQYDLVLLSDEPYAGDIQSFKQGLTAFPANQVTVAVNSQFAKDYPEITGFLSRYQTSSALTAAGLAIMNSEKLSTDQAAIRFLKEHRELWQAWVNDPKVSQKISDALAKEE